MIHRNNTPTWYYSDKIGIAWTANKEEGFVSTGLDRTQMWSSTELYSKYWMLKLI